LVHAADAPPVTAIAVRRTIGQISRTCNPSETMTPLSRRSFLAATAGVAAAPVFGISSSAADLDVAIVGAGAAGVAAARKLVAAGRSVRIFEAANYIGGRCITDMKTFGVPYDLGAHWIHMPDVNPVAKLAPRTGLDVYPAPPGQKLRVGKRYAREGEMEQFLSSLVRSKRAIEEASRRADLSCAQALPKDLGDWQASVEFNLGPFGCAKDLSEVSAIDFSKSWERDIDAFCRQGFGTLLAKLSEGLPVQTATPVNSIDSRSRGEVILDTAKGRLAARTVIVTASTNLLLSGKIVFAPELPKRQLDALNRLKLGSYDHIALEFEGNPLGLQRDDLVFEKANGPRTAALLANSGGSTLAYIDVGGSFGRDLAEKGPREMAAFAQDWLGNLFGADVKQAVKRSHATQWNREPWVLGAFSAASVGGQPSRRILMEPLRERIFFAGEAAHETLWGTVGGAWESGERAADAAIKLIAPPPARQQRQPRR
jgi:monoamine oxidase